MKTDLIIDCQLLQTADRNRGMGLYLLSILQALTSKKSSLNSTLLVSSKLPGLSNSDKVLLESLGSIVELKLLTAKDYQYYAEASDQNRKAIDKLDLVSNNSNKSVFFIPALFSSEIYPVYPSHGTTNLLLFHDVIPYLYPDQYLPDPEGPALKNYAQRWREAYRTNLFVTNSQTTADDLTIHFGIDPSRIRPILGAGAHYSDLKPTKPKLPDLNNEYVLMPSGDDHRKNNSLAVRAFADLKTNTQLVITSNFSEESKRQLKRILPSIVFTGSVSSEELLWLIDNARFVFSPSEYEGLGMPLLEAVDRQATIACSDIPVFKEISEEAFYYFDPKSQLSITATLRKLFETKEYTKNNHKKYEDIKAKFSWDKTAVRFIEALQDIEPAPNKKSLAVFCPSPSSYSAIGKYVFEVHAELSRYFNIDYYYENGQTEFKPTRPNILEYAANYKPAADFNFEANEYDYVLYHIGNSEFHAETILSSLRYPANAIIHDSWLNGIFDFMERYKYITGERHSLEAIIDKKLGTKKSKCLASIATNQKAIFCHSSYVKEAVNEISNQISARKISFAKGVPVIKSSHRSLTISFAGIISESKGINLLTDISSLDHANVKVFGYGVLGGSPLLDALAANVEVLQDLNDKQFQDQLAKTDILINYRINYHGETSMSALEAMRYGAVVVVKNIGWFGELPDDTVVKVSDEVELLEAVKELINNSEKRSEIGQAARRYVAKHHTYLQYAGSLANYLEANK